MKTKILKIGVLIFFVIPFNLSLYINLSTAFAGTADSENVLFPSPTPASSLSLLAPEPKLPDIFEIQENTVQTQAEYPVINDLKDCNTTVNVYIRATDEIVPMTLHDYVISAVAGEMPATFELEALKAQAVAARTFTISHLSSSCSSNAKAHVCTYYGCCQAYTSIDQMKKNWGKNFDTNYSKIKAAVEETDGLCMYFNSKPITVFYFSTSNGYTDACQDVFVKNLPYYKSVESPGEETAPRFYSYVKLSYENFLQTLASNFEININKEELLTKTQITRTPGGRVSLITFNGISVKGTKIRTAFGLRSADFYLTFYENDVLIEVYGNGHGCGMSQFGANYMAQNGSDFLEILNHYYIDVEIK